MALVTSRRRKVNEMLHDKVLITTSHCYVYSLIGTGRLVHRSFPIMTAIEVLL